MNEIIAQVLRDFTLDDYRPIHPRELDLGEPLAPRRGNLVKVIIGMRRSGKSYRLFQEIDTLQAKGVEPSRICYFNFEDERLFPISPQTGDEVLEAFYSLHPEALDEGAYFFFDEIQQMEDWDAWMRRVVDTHKATVYASGSSSRLLSEEIATGFRGRGLEFELLPLSFREWCAFDEGLSEAAKREERTTRDALTLRNAFQGYVERGGFPDARALPGAQSIALLQSYVQQVVARDVVDRHNFAKPQLAKAVAQRLLSNNAKPVSLRKLEGDLRAVGLGTARETLSDLMEWLGDAYLLFAMREFSYSLAQATTSRPKVYAIDPGLALANARANTNDAGQRLENAVYLELRRRSVGLRREAICSYRTRTHGFEVNFVRGDALDEAPYGLFQVALNVDERATLARETRALWEAMKDAGLDESTLIVADGERCTYEDGGRRIVQVPAWEWFLADSLTPGASR